MEKHHLMDILSGNQTKLLKPWPSRDFMSFPINSMPILNSHVNDYQRVYHIVHEIDAPSTTYKYQLTDLSPIFSMVLAYLATFTPVVCPSFVDIPYTEQLTDLY